MFQRTKFRLIQTRDLKYQLLDEGRVEETFNEVRMLNFFLIVLYNL